MVHNQQYRSLSTGPLGISFPSTIPSLAIAGHGEMGFLAIWLPLLRRRSSRSSRRIAPRCDDIGAEHGIQWYRRTKLSGTTRAAGERAEKEVSPPVASVSGGETDDRFLGLRKIY